MEIRNMRGCRPSLWKTYRTGWVHLHGNLLILVAEGLPYRARCAASSHPERGKLAGNAHELRSVGKLLLVTLHAVGWRIFDDKMHCSIWDSFVYNSFTFKSAVPIGEYPLRIQRIAMDGGRTLCLYPKFVVLVTFVLESVSMRASPSGKAVASQATIRGFESRRPLHKEQSGLRLGPLFYTGKKRREKPCPHNPTRAFICRAKRPRRR